MADFAQNLGFLFSVIPHQIVHRCITSRAGAVPGNIALNAAKDRFNRLTVPLLIVGNEVIPVPILFEGDDFWKFINLELLVLFRMGVIKSPLLKREISTDKVNKPANLFVLVLN